MPPHLSHLRQPYRPSIVVGGLLRLGREEQLIRGSVLHHLAQEHEGAFLTGTPGLGHVVGDDEDRVIPSQLPDEIF